MAEDNSINNEFNNIAKSMSEITQATNDLRVQIRKVLIDSVKELSDITKEYNNDLKDQNTAWGQLTKGGKNYEKEIKKAIQAEIDAGKRKEDLVKRTQELQRKYYATSERAAQAKARLEYEAAQKQLGNLNQTIKGAQALRAKLKEAAEENTTLGLGFKKLANTSFKQVISSLSFASLVKFLGESNKQTVELAKTIGGSIGDAADLKFQFAEIAAGTSKASINVKNLTEGYLQLAQNTQATAGFTTDQLIAQTELTKLVGLQSKESSELVKLGILNNKSNEQITGEILNQVKGLEKETGIRLDGRRILAEVANINGQLAAQYQFNNKLLAEAVVKVKQFGLNLKDAENIANSLLNFEQSIGAELSAELLTGKNLNLERARSLALAGDTAAAAAEVAQQFGSAEEFTNMNVLQQRELAKAVGLTADQLSNSIKEREILRSLGAENLRQLEEEGRLEELNNVKGGEALYQQYLQQSTQEKFNEALTKMQGIVVSIVEAFTPIINIVNAVLDSSVGLGATLGLIAAVQIPKILAGYTAMIARSKVLLRFARMQGAASIFGGFAKMGPVGIALAGAAIGAMTMAILKQRTDTADDMYGNVSVMTKKPYGHLVTRLNNNDQFAAGPGVADALNRGGGGGMSRGDLDYLINGINSKEVKFNSYAAATDPNNEYRNAQYKQPSNTIAQYL